MKKILIVDDLRLTIEKEKSILSRKDLALFTAGSGEEALRIHRTEKVDLIVVDLDMQGMGGDELCSIIRKDETLKKVSIIITCYNRKSAIERCEACGANAWVPKPLVPGELFRKVNELLNIPKRESLRVLVKVSVKGKFRNDFFFANSENVSASGILLETERVLAKGDRITCSFFLTSSQITTEGEVVRVARKTSDLNYYGVHFIDLAPHFRSHIEEFVKRHRTGVP